MKRYRPDTTLTGEEAITEDNFGEYVKYSEVAIKIGESIASVEQANQAVLAASDTIQKLVAENAALKASQGEIYDYTQQFTNSNDREMWSAMHDIYKLSSPLETPATDAFTAELRAQGVDEAAESAPWLYGSQMGVQVEAVPREGLIKFAANLRAGRKG